MTTTTLPPNRILRKYQIQKIIDHNKSIRELSLKSVDEIDLNFQAGQFVMLHVPQKEGKPVLRAYSIASPESDKKELRLIFKYVDQGKASEYIWSCKEKDLLTFTGSFGKVLFKTPPTQQVLFLNTGTGITQHLSFIYSKFSSDSSNSISRPIKKSHMLFGVRHIEDIYLKDELDRIKSDFPFFSYDFVLSRPSADWKGLSGYVQDHIKSFDYLNIPTTFYLCGNGSMIKETKKILLEEDNYPQDLVIAEAFD